MLLNFGIIGRFGILDSGKESEDLFLLQLLGVVLQVELPRSELQGLLPELSKECRFLEEDGGVCVELFELDFNPKDFENEFWSSAADVIEFSSDFRGDLDTLL